jgi:hypothetical protein
MKVLELQYASPINVERINRHYTLMHTDPVRFACLVDHQVKNYIESLKLRSTLPRCRLCESNGNVFEPLSVI